MDVVNTEMLNVWVDRLRAGDRAARDELVRGVCQRLERLARKMLHQYPAVRQWAQTDDVLQNALMRLLRALEEVRPNSMRDFIGLAAEQMRRELLDLARHFRRAAASLQDMSTIDPADGAIANDLEEWSLFHEHVNRLPTEEREVVSLVFYHGWSQADVAQMFQVSVRTVQRRWESALAALHAEVKKS